MTKEQAVNNLKSTLGFKGMTDYMEMIVEDMIESIETGRPICTETVNASILWVDIVQKNVSEERAKEIFLSVDFVTL